MLSNSSKWAVRVTAFDLIDMHHIEAIGTRGSPSTRAIAPDPEHEGRSRPMRPMPLMPTLMALLLDRKLAAIAELVQAGLERHAFQCAERQANKGLQSAADHSIELVEQREAFDL